MSPPLNSNYPRTSNPASHDSLDIFNSTFFVIFTTRILPILFAHYEPGVWPSTSIFSLILAMVEMVVSVEISRLNLNVCEFIWISLPSLQPTKRCLPMAKLHVISREPMLMYMWGGWILLISLSRFFFIFKTSIFLLLLGHIGNDFFRVVVGILARISS